MPTTTTPRRSPRLRVFEVLEEDGGGRIGRWARATLVVLILTSVAAAIAVTVPEIQARIGRPLDLIEDACLLVFTLEYGLRLWSAVEDPGGHYAAPVTGRLRFALTPMALVDLLAILPYWLAFLIPVNLTALRALRLLRLLKLTRHSLALETLEIVVINEARALLAVLAVLLTALVVLSGFMHYAEAVAQPQAFGSIPAAMWWGIATLTTVGYGDVVPVTALGRLIAGLTAMLGIAMFALPTAIIGAGFVQEIQKRGFVATASIIARVPQFRHLAPAQLAELTALLQRRDLPGRYTVVRRGEHAHAMWFVADGRVAVQMRKGRLVLGPGSFFGEIALLHGVPRTATVVTLTSCRLLELTAADFHRLLAGDPVLRAAITEEAQRRHAMIQDEEGEGSP